MADRRTRQRGTAGRRRRNRAGFFVIFGWRVINTRESAPPARATCPACGEEADFVGLLRRRWFTLFFLPVVPLDPASAGQRLCRCNACRTIFDRPLEQVAGRGGTGAVSRGGGGGGGGGGNDWAYSISLYNKLRDNPTDSGVMLQLLQTYEAMNEPSEAEAAARHFPQAIEADPRCRAVLERMRKH
jgi:hypothetical protein